MLIIKASAKPSAIHGIGLFADQEIKKGTIIWKYNNKFDISFTREEMNTLNEIQKNFVFHFAYLSKISNKYILSIDDSRFINHSINNNMDSVETSGETESCAVAKKDITIGEEITVNYCLIDADDEFSKEEYLNK